MEKSFFKNALNYFKEYCSRSSVHGFQYLGEKQRTVFEKIWWFIVFIACLAACIFSIYAVYGKWEQSPVIVSFANRGTPIYKIPFPAVTICPEAKSTQEKLNYTELLQKKEDGLILTPAEEINFEYMSLLCNYYPELNYLNNLTFSNEFYDFIDEVKPRFKIQNCSFMSLPLDCDLVFSKIFTDEGICYTFNMLNRSALFREDIVQYKNYHVIENFLKHNRFVPSWSLESGYSEEAKTITYPLRAYLSGATTGFSFNLVTPKNDLDYACKSSLQGYRIQLHTPMTIPRPSKKFFRVPLDQSVVAAVHPAMITTSNTVKAYSPKRRKCYFAAEYPLKYFSVYTSENCKLECLTNYTLWKCGCVNFFMPRFSGTEICAIGKMTCMMNAEVAMYMEDLYMNIEENASIYQEKKIFECNCLPTCSDLNYDVETSQTDWNWQKLLSARRKLPRFNNVHLSSVTIFFASDNFITSERNELYGPLDFLANFGGILGLFTGFSVLSLMEVLYFLTIRIICNLRLYGRWAGPEK